MTDEDLGAGVYLDSDLDFEVDPTGDIRTTSGRAELEKDLSFQMVVSLSDYLGKPPNNRLEAQIINTAKAVALSDVRITNVDEEGAVVSFEDNREQINLTLPVTTDAGQEYDLVFEI